MPPTPGDDEPHHLRFAVDTSHGVLAGPQATRDPIVVQHAISDLVYLARIADRAGIDSFWASEDPDGWDAIAMLSVLAWETDRIRIGPGVFNPWFRHPSLIAASIATLDALSDGRAFLGFGRGQTEWYDRALGMDVSAPVAAIEEAIELLRQWWQRPWVAESRPDARVFRVSRWQRSTGPIQARPPIYLAAVGPKALAVAARHADGVIFNDLASITFMERSVRSVRQQAREAGRDPDAIAFFARAGVTITDNPEAVWEARKDTVSLIHALPGMARLLETPGIDVESMIETVRGIMHTDDVLAQGGNFLDIREEGDFAEARRHIPTDLMRDLVIAGPVDDVRRQLRRLREIGVTDVFLARPARGVPAEQLVDTVRALSGV